MNDPPKSADDVSESVGSLLPHSKGPRSKVKVPLEWGFTVRLHPSEECPSSLIFRVFFFQQKASFLFCLPATTRNRWIGCTLSITRDTKPIIATESAHETYTLSTYRSKATKRLTKALLSPIFFHRLFSPRCINWCSSFDGSLAKEKELTILTLRKPLKLKTELPRCRRGERKYLGVSYSTCLSTPVENTLEDSAMLR
ncbi:Protein of unknown function [Pyronema omphalodes CBS 100304]|uniref:Uncharacterized protein n=1 Tax=Pyronema omphalodes (strain CBS 100304) TaxID=1076935 RepID=U4LJT8_PYROM|nr:Protein of unknown function [Pyronema omphalodes CBS 100304]